MPHHKRRRPKNARSGCLMCKPHKMNGARTSEQLRPNERRRLETPVAPDPLEFFEEDDAQLWDRAMELLRSEGEDPDELVRRAVDNLNAWRADDETNADALDELLEAGVEVP